MRGGMDVFVILMLVITPQCIWKSYHHVYTSNIYVYQLSVLSKVRKTKISQAEISVGLPG